MVRFVCRIIRSIVQYRFESFSTSLFKNNRIIWSEKCQPFGCIALDFCLIFDCIVQNDGAVKMTFSLNSLRIYARKRFATNCTLEHRFAFQVHVMNAMYVHTLAVPFEWLYYYYHSVHVRVPHALQFINEAMPEWNCKMWIINRNYISQATASAKRTV